MFRKIRTRITDMAALAALLQDAEKVARADGRAKAGAEDIVIAALRHEDGRAKALLAPHGVDADAFAAAVRDVHADALAGAAGPTDAALPGPTEGRGPYAAETSAQDLTRTVADGATGFDSADFVRAASHLQRGTVALAFRRLGVDPL